MCVRVHVVRTNLYFRVWYISVSLNFRVVTAHSYLQWSTTALSTSGRGLWLSSTVL